MSNQWFLNTFWIIFFTCSDCGPLFFCLLFVFTAVHFRDEFYYVGHVGQQKLSMGQSEFGNL